MAMENVITTRTSETKMFILTTLAALVCITLIVLAMPNTEMPRLSYTINEPWLGQQIISPGEILIKKDPKAVEREREEALRMEYLPYYHYDPTIGRKEIDLFNKKYNHKGAIPEQYVPIVAEVLREIYEDGFISQTDYIQMLSIDSLAVFLRVDGNEARRQLVRDCITTKKAYENLVNDPRLTKIRAALLKCNINDYLVPNINYDERRSEQAKEDLLSMIPTNSGIMKQGQEIINRGDIVTEEKALMIDSYNDFVETSSQKTLSDVYITYATQALYVTTLIVLFMFYLRLFRRDYLDKPRSLGMVFCLITIFPVMTSLVIRLNPSDIYIMPLCLVPIFIRIFLDSRTAFMAHAIMVLICAAAVNERYEFIFVQMVAGLVTICALRELSKRSQIFSAAGLVTAASMLAYTLVKFIGNLDMTFEFLKHGYFEFIANGILLLLAYPLMFLIEKVFKFVSPVTLFELSDTNRTLLRRLSEVAPGTFQHSITVSNLASAIATEIGAKALLVRTGALYHDIGKMVNPVFFTENQAGINPHDRMTPMESAQIIIGHVTEGVKLAERNGIPDVIRTFILTHHGTSLAKYFYTTYRNANPDEDIDEAPFRYPGPNPFSQEQAILMMADAVEAASRSLPSYTEESITNLVNRIIDTQVADGNFVDCPITFRDIATAKRVLVERLKSIYHTRITYPELKGRK
jgi:hypothetical protein